MISSNEWQDLCFNQDCLALNVEHACLLYSITKEYRAILSSMRTELFYTHPVSSALIRTEKSTIALHPK